MNGNLDIGAALAEFFEELVGNRGPACSVACEFSADFGGWLRQELCMWLARRHTLVPGLDIQPAPVVELAHTCEDETFTLHLRVRNSDTHWHYLDVRALRDDDELDSWVIYAGIALQYMHHMTPSASRATASLVVVGIDFDADAWRGAVGDLVHESAVGRPPDWTSQLGERMPVIRWTVADDTND
jgi:hypothetical protein